MLLLMAMLAAVATAVPDKVQPTPLKPVGNPGDWITSEDYPKSALRMAATGRTQFRLDVDAQGNVSDCTITQSSGNDGLDAAACALLKDRAHFIPARDGNGRPVAGSYSSSVAWQMPSLGFPLASSVQTVTFDVGADGVVLDCKGEGADCPGSGLPSNSVRSSLKRPILHGVTGKSLLPSMSLSERASMLRIAPRIDTPQPAP